MAYKVIPVNKVIGEFSEFAFYMGNDLDNQHCIVRLPAKTGSYKLGDYGASGDLAKRVIDIEEGEFDYSFSSKYSQTYCFRIVGYR